MNFGITILINNVCTKKCKYCYETNKGDKVLTFSNVDSIIQKFSTIKYWDQSIEFFGGEPSLSLPVIERIMEKYPSLNYVMITNGYFLNQSDYLLYVDKCKKLDMVFSIEGTEYAHNYYRGETDNYRLMIDNIINLKNKGYRVSVNVSINNKLMNNLEEFINNMNKFIDNDIPIHFYHLKNKDVFNTIEEYVVFISGIKKLDYNIFKMLVSYKDDTESDIEFLCTFDNKVTISQDLQVVNCAWDNKPKMTLEEVTEESIHISFINSIANNHKSRYSSCDNCTVPVGECHISCVPFIESCLESKDYETLEKLCGIQKINRYIRKQINK